ncbi:MAG TPA: hypothetical protein VFB31_01545 [Pseudolabrys sp.]|nr:hypothetical protein [Pseudolabrys sp.]
MQKRNTPDKHKRDDEAQSKRFINAAREAEADESKEGADAAFKKVTRKGDKKDE